MSYSTHSISILVAILLILTVISQIAYSLTLSGVEIVDGWPLRSTIWTTEILLFSAIVFGLSLFRRDNGLSRVLGLVSLLAGITAVILNISAVRMGLGAVPSAGMAGAIATFLAGCTICYASRTVAE